MKRSRLALLAARSPYATLGLQDGVQCTPAALKRAFHKQAALLHPDVGGNAEEFKMLCAAYEMLRSGRGEGVTSSSGTERSGSNCGFYDGVHAQWSSERGNWRRAQRHSSSSSSSSSWASHEHFRAQTECPKHGEGLGEEFSASANWDPLRGRFANRSTRDFYRPYESDYSDPFAHGFTEEEILEAKRVEQRRRQRAAVKYGLLLAGLLWTSYSYATHNRLRQAAKAKEEGYKDPTYWAAVDADRARYKPLRQDTHWLLPREEETDSDKTKSIKPRPQSGAHYTASRAMRVTRFQGRPFTPTGIHGSKFSAPKRTQTYEQDESLELLDERESEP